MLGPLWEETGVHMVLPHVPEQSRNLYGWEQERKTSRATESNKDSVIHVVLDSSSLEGCKEAEDKRIWGLSACFPGPIHSICFLGCARIEGSILLCEVASSKSCTIGPLIYDFSPDKPLNERTRDCVFISRRSILLIASDEESELPIPIPDVPSIDGL